MIITTSLLNTLAIEREKAYQKWIIETQLIPKKHCPIEQLTAIGFVLSDYSYDFYHIDTMPVGWKLIASDNTLLVLLIDSNGIERLYLVVKNAHYDKLCYCNHYRTDDYYKQREEELIKRQAETQRLNELKKSITYLSNGTFMYLYRNNQLAKIDTYTTDDMCYGDVIIYALNEKNAVKKLNKYKKV